MKQIKLSLITTVFNEQDTIIKFLQSIFEQTKLPDEIIIVDGGSTDNTLSEISKFKFPKYKNVPNIKILFKKGNRSIGRNFAIDNALGEIILISDAGNLLDKRWIENISKPFLKNKNIDVVAGYYKGVSKNIFQKCLIPYALVMEDKIKEKEFLPATRSMAIRKSVWKKAGGFDENLSHNEDYAFSNRLKSINAKILFEKKAIVNWIPRKNLKEAFIMFFRFAFGDAESGLFRDKVLLIFSRYIFYLYLIILFFLIKSPLLLLLIFIFSFLYLIWSFFKNYKYVGDIKAIFILPILQVSSDIAILAGTSIGTLKLIQKFNYKLLLKNNLVLILLIIIYTIAMLSVITSGVPNQNHPFVYQMDEWHQMQSVRNVFKYGSPNLIGSANGTMFNFFISGIMLIPFYLTKIVNPFMIKSAVDLLQEQEKLFIVLRLFTLFFGVLTIISVDKIAKLMKLNRLLTVLIFISTPVWLVLSNFFKYDIALMFWVTLSIYYLIKYFNNPSLKIFLISCFLAAAAFSVKVGGLPMLPILIAAYFLFTPSFTKHYSRLLLGIFIFLFFSIFLGLPDIFFGGRNMNDYLFSNVVSGPLEMLNNHRLGESLLSLTVLHKFPAIFGHPLYIISILSIIYVSLSTIKNLLNKNYNLFKLKLFILLSFTLFLISLIPLGITISANRAVVLLPFFVILVMLAFKDLIKFISNKLILKTAVFLLIGIFILIQIVESFLWVKLKSSVLPQESSSIWILKNVPSGSKIGIENIPIYQFEPDFILKEFYAKQYYPNTKTKYNYFVINNETQNFPEYIILSNVDYEKKYIIKSPKNDLVKRITSEGYIKIAYFPLDFKIYKYFDNNFYVPFVGLYAYPDAITIYKKDK